LAEYITSLPLPDVTAINGVYDRAGYEELLNRILKEIVKAQLLELEESREQ